VRETDRRTDRVQRVMLPPSGRAAYHRQQRAYVDMTYGVSISDCSFRL